jgi:hypothetical protein
MSDSFIPETCGLLLNQVIKLRRGAFHLILAIELVPWTGQHREHNVFLSFRALVKEVASSETLRIDLLSLLL